ncbi:hypothetical protein K443DRAFT_12900 [Laccaria amethystina LaAM-08-1]|uniref:Kinesin light chain n=1 Tax=Laccaria amethystina LaAM-08-1 TaxID=1095629 RepID=A0A0C9WQG0_9AGAR|nr:hypothetical protein K443DRAFT_12900 [Laccaria amethystina LaAM-08-1]
MNNLAVTYSDQGKYKEAGKLKLKVLDLCKRVLGPQHPDTLTSMNSLAGTYSDQGQYEEAEELEPGHSGSTVEPNLEPKVDSSGLKLHVHCIRKSAQRSTLATADSKDTWLPYQSKKSRS